MRIFLVISVIAYLTLTFGGGTAALIATFQIYTLWGREPPEILSASIVNTAAIFAATTFIGVLDMFMTLWTLLKSKEWEEEARKEREADRQAAAADRQAREKEREAREKERLAREKEREAIRQLRERELQEREAERLAQQTEWEAARRERESELQARIQAAEAERAAQTLALQENRAFQQQILDQLAAERVQRDLMTARVLDLLEQVSHRMNGNGARPAPGDNPAE